MSERFGNEMALLKHQLCEGLLQSDCEKRPKIPRNFLIERSPRLWRVMLCATITTTILLATIPLHSIYTYIQKLYP